MDIICKQKASLGLEPFDVLGFSSEEELNQEISKLIKVRFEFEDKFEINSIQTSIKAYLNIFLEITFSNWV